MRPPILNPLFAPVSTLPGVGPKLAKLYGRLLLDSAAIDEARLIDLLFHRPVGAVDRRNHPGIALSPHGAVVTLLVRIADHRPPPRGSRQPYRVIAHDDTGELSIVFFHAHGDWLTKQMPVGEMRWVSGTVEWFNGAPQMAHPDHIVTEAAYATLPKVEPVYPLTEGLSLKAVGKAMRGALDVAVKLGLPEWQDAAWLKSMDFPSFSDALQRLHAPQSVEDVTGATPALARLAYDELLANQLALALVRDHTRRAGAVPRRASGVLSERLRAALPFSLTNSQEAAITDILADIEKPERMTRLIQGDVGAGKTLVAAFAMAAVAEAGGQSALMAPTELLARQHHRTLAPLGQAAGLTVEILTGRERGRPREAVLERLAAGEIDILVGTHAVFQAGVTFKDLGLAVVDEQHRFGVHQRLALAQKGAGAHLLLMTATPIPRTLQMTYFGDVDVSKLTEKPAGRKPIDTRTVALDRLDEVANRIARAVDEGRKAYWVCPLVEESEMIDLAAAQERAEVLGQIIGAGRVGLVHGRMKPAEKDAAMAAFQTGTTRVLVSTTVIEVGVDVPDATIMVIEHAERFGLAQLHQLRGRVGRGADASTCLLLFKAPLGAIARERLDVMRQTNDGFEIAEMDLKLRGGGEVLGTRQSGLPGYRLASLELHADLMQAARDDAKLMMARDPGLTGERGEALRVLLYLFGRDDAVRLIRAG
jgi:ATP-dependent DNA helicase RecG